MLQTITLYKPIKLIMTTPIINRVSALNFWFPFMHIKIQTENTFVVELQKIYINRPLHNGIKNEKNMLVTKRNGLNE